MPRFALHIEGDVADVARLENARDLIAADLRAIGDVRVELELAKPDKTPIDLAVEPLHITIDLSDTPQPVIVSVRDGAWVGVGASADAARASLERAIEDAAFESAIEEAPVEESP